ncbi:MAG TPA: alpha/beta fold hydrolase [Chlorobaculum parvum]|uniref:Alpha/beta fold hydrolase n=1 Tax=Chlorobaculum parvum TaxID=274539 RepID=A0A7C5DF36_9CHLB|nr:alpha/beta fold hydrolase [Chlorobaculum parvum]
MLTFTGSAGGDAGNVLLLHAFPVSADMWEQQLAPLAESGYRVIAPYVYGFDSSPSRPGWSMDDYAHSLARLIRALDWESATVVGLSMGGYQAMAFYRLYPELIDSLVLCDTRANADAPETLAARQEFRDEVMAKGSAEAAERMVPNFFATATYESNEPLVEKTRQSILRQTPEAISEAMRAIAEREDSTELLNEVTCPTLIINGMDDKVTPPETAAEMHALIPGSKLELIPDAGHLSNLEQPAMFNGILLEHLRRL